MSSEANKTFLIKQCVCGEGKFDFKFQFNIPVAKCVSCGVIHQLVSLERKEYDDFYKDSYHGSLHNHTLRHDVSIAKKRLANYCLNQSLRLLDVGSGNGAFIREARKKGIEAWGCEIVEGISKEKDYTYEKDLLKIHFPTDYFDVVTLHDVFEHFVNPALYIKEIQRILKPDGIVIIDIPDFWSKEGKHHWRPTQHLWFFRIGQLKGMLSKSGFKVGRIEKPIPGKILLYARKEKEERKSILVLPGIGDIYWVLAKLQSFIEKEKIGLPDVYISSWDGRERSYDYLQRIPFVNAAGYKDWSVRPREFRESYALEGRSIFKDINGCDYYISYNGILRFGNSLEGPDTNWFFPMFESLGERKYHEKIKSKHGEYLVAYFSCHGMFKSWLKEFPYHKIKQALKQISNESGKKIILIGSNWDRDGLSNLVKPDKEIIDLIGKTTFEEALGLLRYSDGILGFPSGVTILGTYFKNKTMIIWNDYFEKRFWKTACSEESWGKWYFVKGTEGLSSKKLSEDFSDVLSDKPIEVEEIKARKLVKRISGNGKITVACVLKSGGDYGPDYVSRLKNSVARNLTLPHKFVCLSDMDVDCERIKLKDLYPGWWSKLELFRPGLFDSKVLYLDLDTVILRNIDGLVKHNHRFSMLHGMRESTKHRRASGIMAWNGDYSFIYDEFKELSQKEIDKISWDQRFIIKVLRDYGVEPEVIQNIFRGVLSYKNNIRGRKVMPRKAKIICFHGKPRPHEALEKEPWMKKAWR